MGPRQNATRTDMVHSFDQPHINPSVLLFFLFQLSQALFHQGHPLAQSHDLLSLFGYDQRQRDQNNKDEYAFCQKYEIGCDFNPHYVGEVDEYVRKEDTEHQCKCHHKPDQGILESQLALPQVVHDHQQKDDHNQKQEYL